MSINKLVASAAFLTAIGLALPASALTFVAPSGEQASTRSSPLIIAREDGKGHEKADKGDGKSHDKGDNGKDSGKDTGTDGSKDNGSKDTGKDSGQDKGKDA